MNLERRKGSFLSSFQRGPSLVALSQTNYNLVVVLFKIGEMRGEGSLPQFTRGCGRAEDRGRRSRQYQAWGHLPVRKKNAR
jgi:hypothetical protein